MARNRLVVLGSDAAYFEYTWIALSSFLRFNPGWAALVMDVGLTPDQADALGRLARVVRYPRDEARPGNVYIPSAKARCMAMAELPGPDQVVLYLDGDTVTLGPVDPLVQAFLASGRPIGLAAEDDPRFFTTVAREGWADGRVPDEFPGRDRWQSLPPLNTGVVLATGPSARAVGDRCLGLYDRLKDRFRFAEQTLIDAVVYDNQVPVFPIPLKYHCYLFEDHLSPTGKPYLDPVLLDGEPVVIRHFCTRSNKAALDRIKPALADFYQLPAGAARPPKADPGRCVVLVPVGGTTEPDCERALHELERRGYQVRRAYGYSAIDFGRSALASQALRDGFDELMWVDSDVGFHPDAVDQLRRHGLPIACGLYPKKDRKSFACHFLPGTDRVVFGAGGGLREILYAGFGFVHTRREVYERVKDRVGLPECNQRFGPPVTPWFLPEVVPDGAGWWYLAEDYAFCHRARRCGYKMMADTTIRLTHVGRHGYCWEDFGDRPSRYTTLEIRFGAASLGGGPAGKGGAVQQVTEPTPPDAEVVPGPPVPPAPEAGDPHGVAKIDGG